MTPLTTRRCAGTALRLLRQLAELLGPGAEPGQCHEREWASATFAGARHSLSFRLPLDRGDSALPESLASLPEHQFVLPGEIVADCAVAIQPRARDGRGQYWLPVTIEILTVTAD